MDYPLCKNEIGFELGVHWKLPPLFLLSRTLQQWKLQGDRLDKKSPTMAKRIVSVLAKQSGRNFVPVVHTPMTLYGMASATCRNSTKSDTP